MKLTETNKTIPEDFSLNKYYPVNDTTNSDSLSIRQIFEKIYEGRMDHLRAKIVSFAKEFYDDFPIGVIKTFDRLQLMYEDENTFTTATAVTNEQKDEYYERVLLKVAVTRFGDSFGFCNTSIAKNVMDEPMSIFNIADTAYLYSETGDDLYTIDLAPYIFLNIYDNRMLNRSNCKVQLVRYNLQNGEFKFIGPEFNYDPIKKSFFARAKISASNSNIYTIASLVNAMADLPGNITITEE